MRMEILPCRHRPWPDLTDPLLEIILERLPLSAYVRFSAVCRRWRSVQAAHRRRHSPSPPPMLRLPWLVSSNRKSPENPTISCYSPFEDRHFTIPLPPRRFCFPYSDRGWLFNFTSKSSGNFFLWNPISGQKIEPPGSHCLPSPCFGVKIVSPPPNYVLSFMGISSIFLFRWFDPWWVELQPPPGLSLFNRTLFCGGKYYCICSPQSRLEECHSHDLLVSDDPLAAHPTFQYFEMAAADTRRWRGSTHLVEFDERPLLVVETFKYVNGRRATDSSWIGLYRLDLGRKMWVEVESIGDDRVLVFHWFFSSRAVSLSASDIGARGNCVYFLTEATREKSQWKVFD